MDRPITSSHKVIKEILQISLSKQLHGGREREREREIDQSCYGGPPLQEDRASLSLKLAIERERYLWMRAM